MLCGVVRKKFINVKLFYVHNNHNFNIDVQTTFFPK